MFASIKIWWHKRRLKAEDWWERISAARALSRLGDPSGVDLLIQKLEYHESLEKGMDSSLREHWAERRAAVAAALGELKDTRAVDPLIVALRRETGYTYQVVAAKAAAVSLGQLRDSRAVEPLITAVVLDDPEVRRAAAISLGQLGEPVWQTIVEGTYEDFKRLDSCGDPRVMAFLVAALRSGDPKMKHRAKGTLTEMRNPHAVEPLITLLGDKGKYSYAGSAARALGEIGDIRAVEPLIEVLEGHNPEVPVELACWDVAWALGQLGDSRAVEPLITMLGWYKYTYTSGHEVFEALGQMGDVRAVEPLIAVLLNKSHVKRGCAAIALGQLGDSRAVEPLIAALEGEGFKGRGYLWYGQAVEALAQLGDARAVEHLFRVLKNEKHFHVLGDYNRDTSHYVQDMAAGSLGRWGDARVVEPLIDALEYERSGVRQAAAIALKLIVERYPECAQQVNAVRDLIDKLLADG